MLAAVGSSCLWICLLRCGWVAGCGGVGLWVFSEFGLFVSLVC